MGMGQVANIVKKAIYPNQKQRIFMLGSTEGAGTSLAASTAAYLTLLNCDDDPADDQITNHSTFAECHPGSEVVNFDLWLMMKFPTSTVHYAMLYKDVDGTHASSVPLSAFGTADYDPAIQHLRSHILAFKNVYLSSSADARFQRLPISRAAFSRNKRMKDGDAIKLALFNQYAGGTGTWWLFGSITTRGPQ